MSGKLYSLFDEKTRRAEELVASAPQNLDSISSKTEDQEFILRKIKRFEEVRPKVDYSDFANFVFFNSAFDYFSTTGEKILNEYPLDGSRAGIQAFLDDLDGYQGYVIDCWPKNSGHLRFNPSVSSSFILFDDLGSDSDVAHSGMLSPGTGSFSVECWCIPPPVLTGSNDAMFVLQKSSGSLADGYALYFSGSNLFFRVSSGSDQSEVSASCVPGHVSYFSFVYDKDLALLESFSGSASSFPIPVMSSSAAISGPMYVGSGRFSIASGSLSGKTTVPLTGALDEFRFWNVPLSVADLSSSFNSKIYAQRNLIGLWSFNETGSVDLSESSVVIDRSGHRLNGRIQNFWSGIRGSGSLLPFDVPDLVLSLNSTAVRSYIAEQQTSGTSFDRDNDNAIVRMLPEQFFQLEQFKNTDVLEKFLYVLARNFDDIKMRIDQLVHSFKTDYSNFDQTPDALLEDVGRYFGWEFTGNFLNADAFQYILGRNVLRDLDSNRELDVKLFEIKNEFWRRTLINLIYLYKTKGTRESVEALFRIYGVNKNFVRLKEHGLSRRAGISTNRISAEKSVYAIALGTGSFSGSSVSSVAEFGSVVHSVESRVRFPTTSSLDMPATMLTGSIWTLSTSSNNSTVYGLTFAKSALGQQTGSLTFVCPEGVLTLSNLPIFDDHWYNVTTLRDPLSSSFSIDVRSIDDGEINRHYSTSSLATLVDNRDRLVMVLGASGSIGSQLWAQELRVWDQTLSQNELDDHALNFQSYGTEEVIGSEDLMLHWRLNEGLQSSSSGTIAWVNDVSTNDRRGVGTGFSPDSSVYKKFLNEYNYVAPVDFGWNEDKVRVFDRSNVRPEDAFSDNRTLSLEFNMVDALNEDISQIVASMDGFNNFIGLPANRYRDTYTDLDALRREYFKRLGGRLNFRVFSDMLEFFDRSFIDLVRRLIPARAVFLGDEFVIESHMLERPKLQWNYRRQQPSLQPEGVIKVYIRT